METDNLSRAEYVQSTRPRPSAVSGSPGVSIVVLNLDKPELIGPMVQTLIKGRERFAAVGLDLQLIIGDTGSRDPETLRIYANRPDFCDVVDVAPYHFSKSNNRAADRNVRCDRLLFLNNDVILPSVEPVIALASVLDKEPDAGAAGLLLDFPGGSVQHMGVDVFRSGELRGFPYHPFGHTNPERSQGTVWPVISVTGAALMARTEIWERVGGLDEGYEREAQDIDFCLRLQRLGRGVRLLDAGPVVHLENATRAKGEESWPDRRLFMRRWQSFVEARYL
jgi:GT2 family glycosyltransferase